MTDTDMGPTHIPSEEGGMPTLKPVSPDTLDFEAAEKAVVAHHDGQGHSSRPSRNATFRAALNAQHQAAIQALRGEVERLTAERDGWQETAAQNQRNTDFYRDLVIAVGRLLGPEVYRCDDGSVSQDVLCLKVPEVAATRLSTLQAQHDTLRGVVREWQEAIAVLRGMWHGKPPYRSDTTAGQEAHRRFDAAQAALASYPVEGTR